MRVMIADDDADDRALAEIAFKELRYGHELEFAQDGEELLEKLSATLRRKDPMPDLVILDLNMPKKDGRAALKEMKGNPDFKHIDVVVFSTSNSAADKNYVMEEGAKYYAVKPSEYSDLLEFFRSLCEEAVDE